MIPGINGKTEKKQGRFFLPEAACRAGRKEMFQTMQERSCIVLRNEDLGKEAYRLEIEEDGIALFSSDHEGTVWGLTTLYHLLREGGGSCECQVITDAPRYHYRGFLLDSSRHFFDLDTIREMIEAASLCKMNRMHWHISDDQGYRLESTRFPELNTVGSWRIEEDGSRYGGFYTSDEVKQIVDFAEERGITIVPEIDVPGHVSAMIAAYPQLSCSGEALLVPAQAGIMERILCAGKEEVSEFVFALLDEVAEMFPSPYFHIGGDEVPKTEWKKCPCCQARMRELNLSDEEELQAYFTAGVAEHLRQIGKIPICWNDVLKSASVPEEIPIQYWNEEEADGTYCASAALSPKREWIYSFCGSLYLDYTPDITPLEKVWSFTTTLRGGQPIPKDQILGIECALWAEYIYDRKDLMEHAFPRMYAVAERAWCRDSEYEDFLRRCGEESAVSDR